MEDIKDDIQEQSSSGVKEFNALKETSITDVVRAMQNKKTMEIAENEQKMVELQAEKRVLNKLIAIEELKLVEQPREETEQEIVEDTEQQGY